MSRFLYYLNLGYCYLWYYTEFAVRNPAHRRPYTYIMRDHIWIYFAGVAALVLTVVFVPGLRIPGSVIWGLVSGHLWWGSKIIHGEQEDPPFLGFALRMADIKVKIKILREGKQ
jgi:hypothetical protein